jgi:transposase
MVVSWKFGDNSGPTSEFKATHRKQRGAKIAHYRCPGCHKEVAAKDPGCPHEGKFGNNVIAQATLLKYEGKMPHRKIHDAMMRLFRMKNLKKTI